SAARSHVARPTETPVATRTRDRSAPDAMRTSVIALGAALSLSAAGCRAGHDGAKRDEAKSDAVLALYPKGRWRLVAFPTLKRTVLWVSHILIRHEGSRSGGEPAFRPSGWLPERAPS